MLKIVNKKEEWMGDLGQFKISFLQSFEWGEVLRASGQDIERVVIKNGDSKLAGMLVYKKTLGHKYVFMPYGPLVAGDGVDSENNWRELLEYIKKNNCIFFKFEPENRNGCPQFVTKKIKLVKDVNPMATMILNLKKTKEEILSSFHPKTRYNLNLAMRKNLRVVWEKNVAVFWELMKKTGGRDNFTLHPYKNYDSVINSQSVRQVIVYKDHIPVATACFWFLNDVCYYLYGASDYDYRQFMAPYLVQWEGILMAQSLGCSQYDLFGVAPKNNPSHRYSGVTRFKSGFNGEVFETPGTFDLPLNGFWYFVYYLSRRLRGREV